jgi:ribosomal protein S18 acetylase RimI-like enzyme
MTRRIARVANLVRRHGLAATATVTLLWFLRRACGYRRAVIYVLDTSQARDLNCPDIQWRYLDVFSVDSAIGQVFGIDTAEWDRILKDGSWIFTGNVEAGPCYFSEVRQRGFIVPDRLAVQFTDNAEAYVGECITLDEYRGRGIYGSALTELARALRKNGVERLFLFVESDNVPSIKGVLKAGFRPFIRCSVYLWRSRPVRRWKLVRSRQQCPAFMAISFPGIGRPTGTERLSNSTILNNGL